MVFYVKAEFGKIHTTLFPGAKELIGPVKMCSHCALIWKISNPHSLNLIPNNTEHPRLEDEKKAIFSTPSAKLSENLDHMKERRGRFWAINACSQ